MVRLVPEQQPLRDGFDRRVQQRRDVEPIDQAGSVKPRASKCWNAALEEDRAGEMGLLSHVNSRERLPNRGARQP